MFQIECYVKIWFTTKIKNFCLDVFIFLTKKLKDHIMLPRPRDLLSRMSNSLSVQPTLHPTYPEARTKGVLMKTKFLAKWEWNS